MKFLQTTDLRTNLKVISKIIEKVVAVRLQKYLEANQLNEPLQSAHKPFHSCETALVRVHNDILVSVDKRHCVMLLLLDLSAAFDTVDHDILLTRLHSKYSISGIALEWFRSYLTNRSQFALIEEWSQSCELKCGVPQGSVLGPILYVSERIKFKILLLTFKALHQQSPTHIQGLISWYLPSRSLRSSSTLRLNPFSFNLKTYGSRAFSVSAPELWNKLPDDIRSCENLSLVKHKLKTYLFKNFYFTCSVLRLNNILALFLFSIPDH